MCNHKTTNPMITFPNVVKDFYCRNFGFICFAANLAAVRGRGSKPRILPLSEKTPLPFKQAGHCCPHAQTKERMFSDVNSIGARRMVDVTVEDFARYFFSQYGEKLNVPTPTSPAEPELVDITGAKLILGGGKKPISTPTFNKIRRKYGLKNVSPTPGRVLFLRSALLSTTEEAARGGLLPAKNQKTAKTQ